MVADLIREPRLFPLLLDRMDVGDPVVRMRAADAMEKVSRANPGILAPFRERLLARAAGAEQKELRWQLAQVLPRLELGRDEKRAVVELLSGYLTGGSSIVNTCVMQALAEIAAGDEALRPKLLRRIERLAASETPAVWARSRKLLARLGRGKGWRRRLHHSILAAGRYRVPSRKPNFARLSPYYRHACTGLSRPWLLESGPASYIVSR